MSGDAFVVRNGLVVDERAVREVGSGDDDSTGALAIRSAGNVVGRGSGLEGGYRFDGHRRLRKKGEELRKLRLHLRDVAAEIVEDLLGGRRNVFGIGFE